MGAANDAGSAPTIAGASPNPAAPQHQTHAPAHKNGTGSATAHMKGFAFGPGEEKSPKNTNTHANNKHGTPTAKHHAGHNKHHNKNKGKPAHQAPIGAAIAGAAPKNTTTTATHKTTTTIATKKTHTTTNKKGSTATKKKVTSGPGKEKNGTKGGNSKVTKTKTSTGQRLKGGNAFVFGEGMTREDFKKKQQQLKNKKNNKTNKAKKPATHKTGSKPQGATALAVCVDPRSLLLPAILSCSSLPCLCCVSGYAPSSRPRVLQSVVAPPSFSAFALKLSASQTQTLVQLF